MMDLKQYLAIAASVALFVAICLILRTRGARIVGSACLFVASLTSVQLAVGKLSKPPFNWHHPGFLVTLHFACVWVGCAAYFIWKGEAYKIIPCSIGGTRWTKNILPYALCMPVSVVLNNVGIMEAGPGLVAVIGTLSPIVTALVSRFFGRQVALLSWFGVLVAMIGGGIISKAEFEQAEETKNGRVVYGMICALLSVLGRAMKIVISDWLLSPTAYAKELDDEEPLSFLHIYVLQFSAGDLVTLLFAFYMEKVDGAVEAWQSLNSGIVMMILVTAIPATILNFMGGVVLRELGATLQQLVGKLNTLVIAAISMAFMGEHLSRNVLLGTCFVLVGVAIFEYGMRREEGAKKEEAGIPTDQGDSSDEGHGQATARSMGRARGDTFDSSVSSSISSTLQSTPLQCCAGKLPHIVLLTAVWWAAAIYVTLMFKMTASPTGEKDVKLPPFTLTFVVNTCTGIIAWALTLALPCERSSSRACELQTPEWVKVVLLGIVSGGEMGCLNKSLEFLSISERTFVQNANVLLIMLLAQILGLEFLTPLRLCAGLLLACGGVLQGLASAAQPEQAEEQASHVLGMVFMVCSMLLTAVKWAMMQFMTQRSPWVSALGRMSKLQLAAIVQPITGLMCLVLAAVFEVSALSQMWQSGDILLRALAMSLGITAIICSELKLVQLTSAVTCGVLINLHHIPIVLAGIILFDDSVQQKSLYGFACCIIGSILYVYARSIDKELAVDDGVGHVQLSEGSCESSASSSEDEKTCA